MSEDSNNKLEEILIALRMAVKKDDEETVDALKKQLLELASYRAKESSKQSPLLDAQGKTSCAMGN